MAHLTQKEFEQAITLLADEIGVQRLRDKLVRMHALVTHRRATDAATLANQLYMLSSGLRRQVPATIGFYAVWNENLHAKLGEDGEKNLEKLAEAVNACLGERDAIIPEKAAELDSALTTYEQALCAAVGPERARLDMLLKAVAAVAEKLRARPLQPANPEPSEPTSPA